MSLIINSTDISSLIVANNSNTSLLKEIHLVRNSVAFYSAKK